MHTSCCSGSSTPLRQRAAGLHRLLPFPHARDCRGRKRQAPLHELLPDQPPACYRRPHPSSLSSTLHPRCATSPAPAAIAQASPCCWHRALHKPAGVTLPSPRRHARVYRRRSRTLRWSRHGTHVQGHGVRGAHGEGQRLAQPLLLFSFRSSSLCISRST
jgi:hypothetical protein